MQVFIENNETSVDITSGTVIVEINNPQLNLAVETQELGLQVQTQNMEIFTVSTYTEIVPQTQNAIIEIDNFGGMSSVKGDEYDITIEAGFATIVNAIDTWTYFITMWSVPPIFVESIAGGDVYMYDLEGIIRYRLVPSPYIAEDDAFYTNFIDLILSGHIVSRG